MHWYKEKDSITQRVRRSSASGSSVASFRFSKLILSLGLWFQANSTANWNVVTSKSYCPTSFLNVIWGQKEAKQVRPNTACSPDTINFYKNVKETDFPNQCCKSFLFSKTKWIFTATRFSLVQQVRSISSGIFTGDRTNHIDKQIRL